MRGFLMTFRGVRGAVSSRLTWPVRRICRVGREANPSAGHVER